jgi:hypothetical protein
MVDKKKTELAEVPAAVGGVPMIPLDMDVAGSAGSGLEGADKDSFAIPFLRVIQKMSPQVDEADAAFMPNAKPGMFINSVTNELISGTDGVEFLPCAFQRRFLRWGPRGGGGNGGFKGEFLPEDVAEMIAQGKIVEVDRRLYVPLPDGTVNQKTCDRFTDTRSHFGLLVRPDGTFTRVLLALASTQIKKSKQLVSLLSEAKVATAAGVVTPPTWLNRIKLTTGIESNDEGSWHGVKIEAGGFITDKTLFEAGKAFNAAIAAGEAKANFAEAEADAGGDAPTGGKF